MLDRILVPLDGSSIAENALPIVTALLRRGGELILLRSPDTDITLSLEPAEYASLMMAEPTKGAADEARTYLTQIGAGIKSADVTVRTYVIEGDPASVIVDTAQSETADLIVMATHGRSGISRWVLGSVTERVLRQAPCPVLAVREPQPVARVIVTLDGSALAEAVLAPALELARRFGAGTTFYRVEQRLSYDQARDLAETDLTDIQGSDSPIKAYGQAAAYLKRLTERYRDEGHDVDSVLSFGKPAENIVEYAQEEDIDLVAMATHGRTGLQRWVYGSVTSKVLRHAHRAVLIIRPIGIEED